MDFFHKILFVTLSLLPLYCVWNKLWALFLGVVQKHQMNYLTQKATNRKTRISVLRMKLNRRMYSILQTCTMYYKESRIAHKDPFSQVNCDKKASLIINENNSRAPKGSVVKSLEINDLICTLWTLLWNWYSTSFVGYVVCTEKALVVNLSGAHY